MLVNKIDIFWLFNTSAINQLDDSALLTFEKEKFQPFIFLSLILICLIGVFYILFKYINFYFKNNQKISANTKKYILVATNFSTVNELTRQIPELNSENSYLLSFLDYQNLKNLFNLRFMQFLKNYKSNCMQLIRLSSIIRPDIWKILFSNLRSNLVNFSFFQTLLSDRNENLSEDTYFVFNDINILAHAAIEMGFHTIYLSHGILGKCNPFFMPKFEKIFFRSAVEYNYYRKKIKYLGKLEKIKPIIVSQKKPKVLIFMRLFYSLELINLKAIIKFFHSLGIEVFIKRHPMDLSGLNFLIDWELNFPVKDLSSLTFEESLTKVKPIFVVGWVSTTLVDALESNIIPISMMDDLIAPPAENNLYPFNKKTISFADQNTIQAAFRNSDVYEHHLKKLHSYNNYI